jgi:hypothetical protein
MTECYMIYMARKCRERECNTSEESTNVTRVQSVRTPTHLDYTIHSYTYTILYTRTPVHPYIDDSIEHA